MYESYLKLTNGDEEKVSYDQIEKIPYPGDQFKVALDFLTLAYQFFRKSYLNQISTESSPTLHLNNQKRQIEFFDMFLKMIQYQRERSIEDLDRVRCVLFPAPEVASKSFIRPFIVFFRLIHLRHLTSTLTTVHILATCLTQTQHIIRDLRIHLELEIFIVFYLDNEVNSSTIALGQSL